MILTTLLATVFSAPAGPEYPIAYVVNTEGPGSVIAWGPEPGQSRRFTHTDNVSKLSSGEYLLTDSSGPTLADKNWNPISNPPKWLSPLRDQELIAISRNGCIAFVLERHPDKLIKIDTVSLSRTEICSGASFTTTTFDGFTEFGMWISISPDDRYVAFNLLSKTLYSERKDTRYSLLFIYDRQAGKSRQIGRGCVRGWVNSTSILAWEDPSDKADTIIYNLKGKVLARCKASWATPGPGGTVYTIRHRWDPVLEQRDGRLKVIRSYGKLNPKPLDARAPNMIALR